MGKLVNRAKMTVSGTPGTGAVTLNAAVVGFQTFAAAGVNDGDVVSYVIEDGTNWEVGQGTYTAAGTSLARTTIQASSSGGSAISASSGANVMISVLNTDLVGVGTRQTVSFGPMDTTGAPTFLPTVAARDLLLHFDGTNGSSTFTDSGNGINSPHAVTQVGTGQLSTAQQKFGTASLLTSTGNYANVAHTADTQFGSGPFTIEAWIYPTSVTNNCILGKRTSGGGSIGWILFISSGVLTFANGAGGTLASGGTISTNTWTHVAATFDGTTMRVFVNGSMVGSGAASPSFTETVAMGIGHDPYPSVGDFAGYIDEVATIKGFAAWTSSFPLPTSAYSQNAGPSRDTLLHFDGTNGSTTFTDSGNSTSAPHTFTATGSAQLSTAQQKFGSASLSLSSGNYISTPNHADYVFGSGPFTLEAWVYPTSLPTNSIIMAKRSGGVSTGWALIVTSTGTLRFDLGTGNVLTTSSGVINTNTWTHVAASYDGTTLRLFINGAMTSTAYSASLTDTGGGFFVGHDGYASGVSDFTGYVDEVAVTKGTAVYLAAFSAPTAAYSLISGSLSISSVGVTASTPLIATAAQGYSAMGAADLVGVASSNLTWTPVANTTSFLPIAISSTGALSAATAQTLAPIYQWEGTPSTTAGQYTFNIAEMQMYLGNGSVANKVAHVIVGEVLSGQATILSASAYAYNGYYDSGWINTLPAASTLISKNANLGLVNVIPTWSCKNLTAEYGYAVGEVMWSMRMPSGASYDQGSHFPISVTRTAAYLQIGLSGYIGLGKSNSGSWFQPTVGSWAYRIQVRREF